MGIFDWLFGGKSEPTSEVPVWPVPDGSKQDDYLKACLEPAFQEEKEERTFRSDPAFREVLDPLNSQQYSAAIKAAQRILARFADFDLPYKWLASAHRSSDQLERSRAVLSQGLAKAKRKYLLLTDMGETEWQAGRIHEAVYWWCQALHCPSKAIDSNAFLLLSYVAKGCGLAESERRFLSHADAMRAGQVRLDASTADRLTSLVRNKKTPGLAKAVEQIQGKYLGGS